MPTIGTYLEHERSPDLPLELVLVPLDPLGRADRVGIEPLKHQLALYVFVPQLV